MTVLVGMTAGTVTVGIETPTEPLPEALTVGADSVGTDAPTEPLTEALITPPSVGKTPALAVTVARLPRPKVMQASTTAPEHDVERDVIVLPLIVIGAVRTAGTVTAADPTTGREALTPAEMRPPLVGRALAPSVTLPKGPRPRLTQTLSRPLPEHDCWIAVIVLEPTAVLVGT
jgi:hypothetical protein